MKISELIERLTEIMVSSKQDLQVNLVVPYNDSDEGWCIKESNIETISVYKQSVEIKGTMYFE